MDPQTVRCRNRIPTFSALFCKPSSLLIVLIGILLSFFRKDYIFRSLIRYTAMPGLPNQFHGRSPCVLWMAPFLSSGGYSSEAWSYILALNKAAKNNSIRLQVLPHGDAPSLEFISGWSEDMIELIPKVAQSLCPLNEAIVVCHSEPGAWHPPLFQTVPCPLYGYLRDAGASAPPVVGRTMFETDRLTEEHVARCNRMDYVWVPSDFHVSTFVRSGVEPSKVVKIVQPVDVDFFDPYRYDPLELVGDLVLGETKPDHAFVFLSIFKWELRKGWDVLLKAYLTEFCALDGVAMYLLTNPYHTDNRFSNKIVEFVKKSDLMRPESGWAPVYVMDTHIAQVDMPRLYKAADAFVLASRGEGWGRPLVEAMAMELPVISTNWSGPTEFLTEENSYPLMVEKMSEVEEGPFKGHLWAEPSVNHLQSLMRCVTVNREESRRKARHARKDMTRRFSPEVVADIVVQQFHSIASTAA